MSNRTLFAPRCCSVLQCLAAAVCCSLLQSVTVCCSVFGRSCSEFAYSSRTYTSAAFCQKFSKSQIHVILHSKLRRELIFDNCYIGLPRPRMKKSHLKRHKLVFSRTFQLKYATFAGLNHKKSSKKGVCGVSSVISPFLGGPAF